MFSCSVNHWLLVSAALLLTLLMPLANADAVATVEVDGANVTIDNTVCATAAWRTSSLYAKITPAADIQFKAEYNAPYYQQYMKPKVVPNLVLLIVSLLLFLFFIFWRWIYCCCTCCCNLCKPSADPMKYIADRGMTATKVTAILMAMGIVASGIYGIVEAGPHLVHQTVGTIGSLTGFANEVFDAAYNITTDADSALGIFDDLVVILNVDVNVSGMNSDVTCVGTWLNGMADPTVIADGLESLDTYLSGTSSTSGVFDPACEAVITDLASYGATSTGEYIYITGAYMGYITNAATFLQSTSMTAPGYKLQVTNFENATTTLALFTTYSATPSTAQQTAIDNAGSTLVSTAYELYWHRLPFLITDLTSQSTGYTATQPCMDTLLYQIEHINQTVIALPSAMSTSYELLDNLDMAAAAVMTGADTNPQTLATDLTAFYDSLATSSTINDTITYLNDIISDLQLQTDTYFSSLATEVNSLATATSSANSDVSNAYTAYEAYVSSPSSTTYSDLQSTVATAKNTLGVATDTTTVLGILTHLAASPYSTYLANAQTMASDVTANAALLPTYAALNSLVSAMTTTEDALPAREPYIVAEAAEGVAYHQLPTPKGAVLLSITATVADLNSKITTTTTMVRADITSYNAQILDKIVTLHNETVDKVTAKEDQYLPKVRHYDSYRMTAEYIYFSVVIFIALMLILIVIINFQWAASFFTFLLLLAMLIYGIIGTVFLLLAMVGHDECSNAETQIFTLLDKLNIGSASFNATTLASYYILGEGGSVNAIAESATGVNFVSIENTINNTIQDTVTGITGSYTLRYKLQDEVDDIQDLGQKLFADVDAVHGLVEFQNVHPIYLGAKQLACCDVVDLVGNLWLSMFMAGWFSVVLVVAMFCYIRRLDELPRKRCCGCAFRSYKEFLDPEDKRLAAIKNKGKYMPAGREGSAPGSPGALSVNAIKVGASGSLAGGLITGVSNMSATSTDSSRLLKAGVSEFNSDGTPRASMTPRASSYMVPPELPRVERSTDSQNRQSLLGVQSMSVEASGGSLLSPGTSKKGAARKSFTTKSEQKKAELKNMMRMNQLE
ncbi:hypothetical protein WJX82_007262 [Trebouxia sp. C0006]